MPIFILRPSAVGTYTAWNLGAGASFVAAVDPGNPLAHDDEHSFIMQGRHGGGDPDVLLAGSFYLDTGMPVSIGTVNSLAIGSRARGASSIDSDNHPYYHFIRRDTTDGTLSAIFRSPSETSYTTTEEGPYPRPGGGSWDPSDFVPGNIQGAVAVYEATVMGFRVTSIWGKLDAELASGPASPASIIMLIALSGVTFGAGVLLQDVAAAAKVLAARRGVILKPHEVREAHAWLRADPRTRYVFLGRRG